MRGYNSRRLVYNTLTPEDNALRYNYLRIQVFRNKIKASKILSQYQREKLWKIAKTGDLLQAEREYKRMVSGM